MSDKNDIVAGIRLEGEKEFKEAVTSVNKSLSSMKSELNLVKAEYAGQENSLEALTKKQEVLNRILEEQKKKAAETSKGLDHAKESYENMGKSLDNLYIELEKATDKLGDLEKIYGEGSKEAEEQKKTITELNGAIARGETNYKKAGDRVKDWETKLNNAQAQVAKANIEVGKNTVYMKEAEEATDHCATSINAFGKEIQSVNADTNTFGDSFLANIAGQGINKAVDIFSDGIEKIKDSMYDLSGASVKLAASTGLSESAMVKYRKVMNEIKGDNFGEDYSDISSVMTEIVQIIGELDPSAMTEVTESAITLRDTFGMDVNESIRAADVMMKTMGVDATTAFDLIAKGAQNGLNRSGELTDNITEYAQIWGQAGFSAEQMFSILENGLDSGAYNLDKVNDYVKEFGVSLSDGRIEKNIGSFSEGTQKLFESWKNGEATTSDVFYSVISDLENMENKQQALTVASETWSALGEDNAMQVITALNDVNDAYSNVKGTMDTLKEVRYSDLESAVSGLGSSIQENLVTPIADAALPTITGLFEKATEVIDGIGKAITPQKTELEQFIDEIKTSNDEVQRTLDNAQSTMDGATADVAELETYKDTLLSLNEETNKTEFQKYQMKRIVSELAGSIPELAAAFDEETSSINLSNTAISQLIDKQEALLLQQASLEAKKEAYQALFDAQMNVAKATSAVQTATDELTDANNRNVQSQDYLRGGYGDYYSEVLDAEIALDKATKTQKEAADSAEQAEKAYGNFDEVLSNANSEMERITGVSSEIVDSNEDLKGSADETAKEFDALGRDISNLNGQPKEDAKAAAQEIVDAYSDMRDGIEDSIKGSMSLFDEFSGGEAISAETINTNLESQIQGITQWSENMKTLAGQIGQGFSQELYDELAAMGPEQSATAVQALVEALNSESGEFEQVSKNWSELLSLQDNADAIAQATSAGKDLMGGVATGITDGSEEVTTATQQATQAAVEAVQEEAQSFQQAGTDSSQKYIEGLQSAVSQSAQAAGKIASAARSALASYQNAFQNTGYNMSAGVAAGIRSGQSLAINAAINMAKQALAAAKREADIHSPSGKFRREFGQQISAGAAFGISDKASLAGKAAKKMSAKVYTNAVAWLAKYKKSQQVSLEDEKAYWQEVIKHTKSGTTAYNNVLKKIQAISITELSAAGLSSSVASNVVKNFGVSKTTGSGKSKKTKDAETYYSEVYSAAEKYLSNQQVLNDWSLQQELAYWEAVRGQLKSGTQAWYDATKQINSIQEDIAQAAEDARKTQASVQKDILDKYKVYYKVSAKAEADYWNAARKQFAAGTAERIEADQKYMEALQDWYDQRKKLDEDYAESSKDINDKLADSVKELQDAYHDAVQSRKEDILSSMDLFESWDASGYDADTLLYNLKTQVSGLALWEQQLGELGKKNLSAGLLEELKAMGPDAAANIYSLNQMTADQLDEYNKLWEQKNALALSQAVKDNEQLRNETNSEIAKLRTEAQAELNMLNADYRAALQELNAGMTSDLATLVGKAGSIGEDAVSGLIAGIGKAANSVDTYNSTTQVVTQVSGQLSALEPEGETIGKNTLDGLLAGMMDDQKIQDSAKSVVRAIKDAMEEEAEINSPSKLFRRETGPQIPAGVALGMEDNTKAAIRSAKEMVHDTLSAAQEEMAKQQRAMQSEASLLDFSGIARLNRLTEQYRNPTPVVNIDNSTLASLLATLISAVNEMPEKIGSLRAVISPDDAVETLQPLMDKANGDAAILMNRGRY